MANWITCQLPQLVWPDLSHWSTSGGMWVVRSTTLEQHEVIIGLYTKENRGAVA